MIDKKKLPGIRKQAVKFLTRAGIVLTPAEVKNIEVAEMGLNRLDEIGLEIVIYVNTPRCCAKELVMFPGQICPQHRHPPFDSNPGKEETFRCRWGVVYLYVPGEPPRRPKGKVPKDKKDVFNVWHEIVLKPGDQYTLQPNTWHWFQAGPKGAIVSEFSTQSRDDLDVFLDPEIQRVG